MKFSYQWLKELSGSKLSSGKMAELLTMRAFEVEKTENGKSSISDLIVVGKVLELSKHPYADKLQLVSVEIGTGNAEEIVCGAWNMKIGDKVPVALPGAKMPAGFEIQEAVIRGVKSCGMLCAEDELGLGEGQSGILILPEDAPIGKKLRDYFSKDSSDTLDIKVLPDRAHDAMSHAFMAREISALEGRKSDYDFEGLILPRMPGRKLDIKIENPKDCRRYIGVLIEGVKVGPSPSWLTKRLKSCDVRSINNVVDVTNYIMLELGSPIHAFDVKIISASNTADKIFPIIIRTRRARQDEEIKILDERIIELSSEDLLISGKSKPLALAGIMGGEESGISSDTTDVILEFANFDPVMIRKSRIRLGLKTEASDRFEKGLDPNLTEKAAVRTTEMILRLAGGSLTEIADVNPKKILPKKVSLKHEHLEKLLGSKISAARVKKILENIGIELKTRNRKDVIYDCVIPTERIDIITAEDLIEEVGRIWGYENIVPQAMAGDSRPSKTDQYFKLNRKIRSIMAAMGFDEEYNYAFYSQKDADLLAISSTHIEITNPVSPEQNLFCASLLPNLVKNAALNVGNFEELKIFELGKVCSVRDGLIKEKTSLGILIAVKKRNIIRNFRDAKGSVENLLESLGGCFNVEWKMKNNEIIISINGSMAGSIKRLGQTKLAGFQIKRFTGEIYVVELDVFELMKIHSGTKIFTGIAKFPPAVRDISFRIPEDNMKNCGEIEKIIRKSAGINLMDLVIFDVYENEKETSYAWRILLGATDRTLRGEEIDSIMKRIVLDLEKEGFQIRK